MSAHKVDHKELQRRLKEDELQVFFQEFIEKSRHIITNYGRQIVFAVIAIALIITAGYLWKVNGKTAYYNSQIRFGSANALLQQDNYVEALGELEELTKSYSGTDVALRGKILLASCYHKNQQYDLALETFQSVLPSLNELDKIPVQLAMVQTLRSLNKPEQGLNELESLESKVKTDELKEQILYLKAGCYEDLNAIDKAIETYKSISSDSPWRMLANQKIEWLEAKPVGVINP